jgi:hypothetical protein
MPIENGQDVTVHEDVTPSLGDALSAALERQQLVPPAAAPAPAAAPVSRPAEATDGNKAAAVPGRTDGRDEHGRFVPKTPGDAAPAAGAATPAPVTAPAAAAPAAAEAPASWRDDIKPLYGNLPEPVKAYVHQRETELQAGFQRIAQRSGVAEAVLGEFAPYEAILTAEKATPIDAIRTLLQTAHALRTGGPEYKKAIILGLVQQYGVDMTTELNPQAAKTEAELARLQQEQMYGKATVQQQTNAQVTQEYEAFANDPANEFFPQVRQIMGGLIGQGYAKTLKEAYDMATGMHPEVRAKLWERHTAASVQNPRKRAAANMSVSNSPNGNMVAAKAGKQDTSIRASIEAALGDAE